MAFTPAGTPYVANFVNFGYPMCERASPALDGPLTLKGEFSKSVQLDHRGEVV